MGMFKDIYRRVLPAVIAILLPALLFSAPGVERLKVKVIERYNHDQTAYTQGLFFIGNQLYESCGEYNRSTFRKVDLTTGKVLQKISFPAQYFAEGAVHLNGKIYVLTWRERVCFVLDAKSFKNIKSFYNPKNEGWGLTTDGNSLIMSDGTSFLYYMNPDNFTEKSKIEVKLNGRAVQYLNELEYINGEIWANVYQSDNILIINPKTGAVRAVVDCTGLLPQNERTPNTDVLNGIAWNESTKSLYLTGKNWPKLFKVEVVR